MAELHPNLILLERLSKHFPHDLESAQEIFDKDFILHYFNPQLPDVTGDYKGVIGIGEFFGKIGALSKGTFSTKRKQLIHNGDELIVTGATHNMEIEGRPVEVDALFIWRVVENKFAEAWDIPAVNTVRPQSVG